MQAVDLTMIEDSVSGVHRSKLIKPGTISLVSSITAGGSSIAAEAAADSDLRTYLQTEMFKAAGAAKVGSQVNNHLGQLASATLEQFRTFSNSCNLLQTVSNNFLKSLANNFNLLQIVANWLQQIATIRILLVSTDTDGGGYEWYMYMYEVLVRTKFSSCLQL